MEQSRQLDCRVAPEGEACCRAPCLRSCLQLASVWTLIVAHRSARIRVRRECVKHELCTSAAPRCMCTEACVRPARVHRLASPSLPLTRKSTPSMSRAGHTSWRPPCRACTQDPRAYKCLKRKHARAAAAAAAAAASAAVQTAAAGRDALKGASAGQRALPPAAADSPGPACVCAKPAEASFFDASPDHTRSEQVRTRSKERVRMRGNHTRSEQVRTAAALWQGHGAKDRCAYSCATARGCTLFCVRVPRCHDAWAPACLVPPLPGSLLASLLSPLLHMPVLYVEFAGLPLPSLQALG